MSRMQDLLFLSHRIPFPPNKGDKVRSFNMLRYLATRYRIHLGAFVDQPEDWSRAGELQQWCAGLHLLPMAPGWRKLASLRGFLTGEPLTLPYYRSRAMTQWVRDTVSRHGIGRAMVFSSSMAQYVLNLEGVRRVVDYCDVDSAKWTEYANRKRGVASWVYRREARRLLDFEVRTALRCEVVTLVAENERRLLYELAPELTGRVRVVPNGVDSDFFSPAHEFPDPFGGVQAVVFTGAMDYWPNVDAVTWFAQEIWPRVHAEFPRASFYVVGMNPSAPVRALGKVPSVVVTGSVPDVRPYLQHARVVVAPLRVARGIQNKVLEAMAMDKPVIAHSSCAAALTGADDHGVLAVASAEEFVGAVRSALGSGVPFRTGSPRAYVRDRFDWESNMSAYAALLENAGSGKAMPARAECDEFACAAR